MAGKNYLDWYEQPFILGTGYGTTLSHVPEEEINKKKKQRIGFHSVKVKNEPKRRSKRGV